MKIITLDADNLDAEHICCALSSKKCARGYGLAKELIRRRLGDGLTFKKMDVRHKVFIEYVPAEHA